MVEHASTKLASYECNRFVTALFAPDDLIEIRAIESPGRVVFRDWSLACQIADLTGKLRQLNENAANVYFGVNPRSKRSGTKNAVACCRCVWADLDDVTLETVPRHWTRANLPSPSIVVASGHGVHLYWLLDKPQDVASPKSRADFESMLRNLYEDLGSDATQDVTRLLRLPGFANVKQAPVPCEIVQLTQIRYSIAEFDRWRQSELKLPKASFRNSAPLDQARGQKQVERILFLLEKPVRDRSRRDFRVVCELIRLGLSRSEIETLVQGKSKFVRVEYMQTTIENAFRHAGMPQ